MVSIRPGVTADILFEGDEAKPQVSPLPAMIYAVTEKRLILSQATPPVSDTRLGKRFLITFLETSEGKSHRYGFWARLRGMEDYELTPSQRVPVLVFDRETEPRIHNLRMNFRIKPTLNKGLSALFQGAPVTIVDISVGGIRISSKEEFPFKAHDAIKMTIGVDSAKFAVEGRVIRTWQARATGGGALLSYASVQFLDNQAARESLLSKKIILLERELLSHGVQ
ncbi:MAG: PilZ domain-containing protein [Syntrophales bacterium]